MNLFDGILESEKQHEHQTAVAGPILAVDVGSVNTRAVLLDVVEGGYRFVSHGQSASTVGAPWHDVLAGVYDVLGQIADATGREIVDGDGDLVRALPRSGRGVSGFVASASAGQPIRAILFGLVPGYSLHSGQRAAESIYLTLVDTFALDDPRTPEQQVKVLLNTAADLVIVVGGTDGGATGVMRAHLDTLLLAYGLMKPAARPPVLFAGNHALAVEFLEKADALGFRLLIAENVRPALRTEYLGDAQEKLASFYGEKRANNTPGMGELASWAGKGIEPTAHGFGRIVHLLAGLNGGNALGIDLGSMATSVAASIGGRQTLNVFGQLGMGHSAKEAAGLIPLASIRRWLTTDGVEDEDILNYLWNKSAFPHTIPASRSELEIEYAAAREAIRYAVTSARQSWQAGPAGGPLPHFDTILLSGATLSQTPRDGWSLLMALDALLPVGVSRMLLDPYGLAAALGGVAPLSPQAVVQALDAGALYDLGVVVSLRGPGRPGEVVLSGTLKPEGASEPQPFEVAHGEIVRVPLAYGQRATLTLRPVRQGGERSRRKLTVTGGALGVVIDARGRPLRFPRGDDARRERLRAWQQAANQEETP